MDNNFITRVFIIALVLLSTAFHEMAHALVATWLGDPTPGRHGRLTLNPIPHLQPVLTAVILPVVMFLTTGGMMILATTPINPSYFRHPLRDHALVAVAGPIMNVVCAAVMIGALWIPGLAQPYSISDGALRGAVYINLIMAVFNMMPLPPLDGYWIVRAVLPLQVRRATDQWAANRFSFLLVILVGSNLMQFFYLPIRSVLSAVLPN